MPFYVHVTARVPPTFVAHAVEAGFRHGSLRPPISRTGSFVNPTILAAAGMNHDAVFVATCLATALTTALMGLYANLPVALAPGMGLNAYFAFTVVPALHGDWRLALGCVFLSGIAFVAISISPARAWFIDAIPRSLKLAIAAGIGFFLALIGFANAGVVAASPATIIQ